VIAKHYAEVLLRIIFACDERIIQQIGYPTGSGYCRDYQAGYRVSDSVMLNLDADLARHALDSMHSTHLGDWLRLRAVYRDGLASKRNRVNSSLRVFRRAFAVARDEHSSIRQAL
jgi:hypothetical protein